MVEIIHINQVEDFYDFIVKQCGCTEEKVGREYLYKVADKYGSGYINRIILGNSLEISTADVITSINLNKIDVNKMYLVKKVLIENMKSPLSIPELSKRVGLNTYKLKVGFKEIFGTTVFGYLRDLWMEKARMLLENHELNINEIANEIGYSNPSYFAAAFRKKYGVNPGHFRF